MSPAFLVTELNQLLRLKCLKGKNPASLYVNDIDIDENANLGKWLLRKAFLSLTSETMYIGMN